MLMISFFVALHPFGGSESGLGKALASPVSPELMARANKSPFKSVKPAVKSVPVKEDKHKHEM